MPIFPEVSWSRVKSRLIRNHKNFTVNNAIHIIEDILDVRIALEQYNFYITFALFVISFLKSGLFVECKSKRKGLA